MHTHTILALYYYDGETGSDLSVLTPVVEGCEGTEETVVCCVATEEDLCWTSIVLVCV